MASVAENHATTLGLGLDLDYRCQEAEKVLLSWIIIYFSLITQKHFISFIDIVEHDMI